MKKPALQKLIEAIQAALREREWSQADLAKKSGVSQKTISNILRDRGDTTIATAEALAEALGLSLADVFSEAGPAPRKPETIQAVRASNFDLLQARYTTLKEFAAVLDKPPALLSQIRNGANIGSRLARDIEESLGLEVGWMDAVHSTGGTTATTDTLEGLFDRIREIATTGIQLGVDEGELLKLFRRLPADRRADLIAYARFKTAQN